MVKKTILALALLLSSVASLMMTTQHPAIAANIDDMPEEQAIECLAKNIYFESANESLAGQISVGLVVLNRVNDARFPSEICDVIYQGRFGTNTRAKKLHACQFSWTCDGKSDNPRSETKMQEAKKVAQLVYQMHKSGHDITDGATHYHATYVSPSWNRDTNMKRVGKVDTHIFYRWEL